MKKIICLVVALCMLIGVLTSCGRNHYDKQFDFVSDLAEAIYVDDDYKVEEISDEIIAYCEDCEMQEEAIEDELEILEERYEDLKSDYDEYSEEISSSANEAVDEASEEFEKALNYMAINPSEKLDLAEDYVDEFEDIVESARYGDSAEVRETARELRNDFRKIRKEYEAMREDFNKRIEELKDEYGEDIVLDALNKYGEARMIASF